MSTFESAKHLRSQKYNTRRVSRILNEVEQSFRIASSKLYRAM